MSDRVRMTLAIQPSPPQVPPFKHRRHRVVACTGWFAYVEDCEMSSPSGRIISFRTERDMRKIPCRPACREALRLSASTTPPLKPPNASGHVAVVDGQLPDQLGVQRDALGGAGHVGQVVWIGRLRIDVVVEAGAVQAAAGSGSTARR